MVKWKINLILISVTIFSIFVVIFIDSNNINSIFLTDNDDYNNLAINEVNLSKEQNVSTTNNVEVVSIRNDSNEWIMPVEGNYVITTYYNSSHRAVDLYSYKGYDSNILSANNGIVIDARDNCNNQGSYCNGRRGNYIVIKHDISNYYTVYMHLNKIYVSVGDKVSGGDVIASMGNTGYVIPAVTSSNPYNGTHLHFCLFIGEPYKGGYAVNPFSVY